MEFKAITSKKELFEAHALGMQLEVRRRGCVRWRVFRSRPNRVLDMTRNEYRLRPGAWVNRYRDSAGVFCAGFFRTPDEAAFYANPNWERIGIRWVSVVP